MKELDATAVKLIGHNKRRKFVSFINEDGANKVYISDDGKPNEVTAKWIINPQSTLLIDRTIGFPDRAFYGFATGGNAKLAIGFQNEGKPK